MATASQSQSSPGIMVFRPTLQEFRDFSGYVKKMEECGAHRFGIAKVNVLIRSSIVDLIDACLVYYWRSFIKS